MFGFSTVRKKKKLAKTQAVIAEIHNSFDSASDRALEEAQRILGIPIPRIDMSDHVSRLKQKGFTSAKAVVAYDAEKAVVDMTKAEREKANARAQIVQKWAVKYPQYKFIFMDQVIAICMKYGLVCGSVDRYVGDVPKKNALEIVNFKVKEEDIYFHEDIKNAHYGSFGGQREMNLKEGTFVNTDEMMRNKQLFEPPPRHINLSDNTYEGYKLWADHYAYRAERRKEDPYEYTKVPFYICAPVSDMKISEYTKQKGVFLQDIPDPIVLHFVKDGFLIVSKWGLEGDDPSLVNENMN